MAYTKTTWTESTGITPERLNNLESQYDKAVEDAVTEATPELTYYVNASTGNDTSTGLSSGAALKTIGKAIEKAQKEIAANITIEIAAGTYAENIEIENMMCVYLYLKGNGTVNLNGYIDIRKANQARIYNMNITGTNGIIAFDMQRLSVDNTTIAATIMAVQATRVGMITINNCDLSGGECVNVTTVGTMNISSTELDANGAAAIRLLSGTFAYTRGLTGNIGTVPVHDVSGSILVKGSSTITGGADTKSNGGQVFEDA